MADSIYSVDILQEEEEKKKGNKEKWIEGTKCQCYAQVICILYGSAGAFLLCTYYIYVRDVSERELPIQLLLLLGRESCSLDYNMYTVVYVSMLQHYFVQRSLY